jgi:hypothetical protein
MIISHRYKYLFIEVPHTGTTAISRELREHYDGSPILRKHAHYSEFLKVATPEEQTYFAFAGIRNPLDEAVSLYFKYKTNHRGRFTRPRDTSARRVKANVTRANVETFKFIQETNANFPAFFKKTYKLPYNNVSSLSYKYCDFIIRFENIQADFVKALQFIGIEPVRPLPHINKTGQKRRDFSLYYTPEIIDQAKRVFGPFMKKWGYTFPPEWGDNSISHWDQVEFQCVDIVRNFYWKYVRWSPHFYGRLIRRLI